jgi:hypothetical protein
MNFVVNLDNKKKNIYLNPNCNSGVFGAWRVSKKRSYRGLMNEIYNPC